MSKRVYLTLGKQTCSCKIAHEHVHVQSRIMLNQGGERA